MSIFTESVSSCRTEISTNDLDDMQLKYTFDKSVDAAHKPALERELKGTAVVVSSQTSVRAEGYTSAMFQDMPTVVEGGHRSL